MSRGSTEGQQRQRHLDLAFLPLGHQGSVAIHTHLMQTQPPLARALNWWKASIYTPLISQSLSGEC